MHGSPDMAGRGPAFGEKHGVYRSLFHPEEACSRLRLIADTSIGRNVHVGASVIKTNVEATFGWC